jgi:hypothetical protein
MSILVLKLPNVKRRTDVLLTASTLLLYKGEGACLHALLPHGAPLTVRYFLSMSSASPPIISRLTSLPKPPVRDSTLPVIFARDQPADGSRGVRVVPQVGCGQDCLLE